jgi:hypothetical protein
MWVVLLETVLVLGLVVFIVWWTLPRKERRDEGPDREG